MAKSTYSAPISDVYGQSTAIATTLAYGDIINMRAGFKGVQLYCSAAFKFLTTPRIDKVILYDASEDTYIDQTAPAIDNDDTTEVQLGTMTTTDILYVGAVAPYLGLHIDIGTQNSTNTTFDEEYSSLGGEWTNLPTTISDGTDSTGTLRQNGLYTWGLPSDWEATSVNGSVLLYYTRFKPLADLTAGTSIDGLITINKGTDYAYFAAGSTTDFNVDEDLVGGLQFLADTGTPTVYVNHIYYKG